MPTSNPRVNVVLEEPLYRRLMAMAKKERVSLSLQARDIISKALETYEDRFFGRIAEKRLKTPVSKCVSHQKAWAHLKRK